MDIVPEKRCSKCKTVFPATHEYFTYDKSKKDGWYSCCRACYKIRSREVFPEGYSRCEKCKQLLPATREYFSPCKKKRNGVASYCKKCYCKIQKSRYKPSERQLLTPDEKKANKRASDKRYAEKNKVKLKAYYHEYYEANKVDRRAKIDKWIEDNPERVKINNKVRKAKRRALEQKAEGHHSAADVRMQYKSQKGKCWWCGCKLDGKYHSDHLIPLKRGGTNWPNNIVVSCTSCNCSRREKLASEWIGRLF